MPLMQITTRKQAIEARQKHYFTGRPCMYGHVEKRYVSGGACAKCRLLAQRKASKLRARRAAYTAKMERRRHEREFDAHQRALAAGTWQPTYGDVDNSGNPWD